MGGILTRYSRLAPAAAYAPLQKLYLISFHGSAYKCEISGSVRGAAAFPCEPPVLPSCLQAAGVSRSAYWRRGAESMKMEADCNATIGPTACVAQI